MADTATGRVDKVAQDFEAVFLSEMLQHMFEGVDFGGLSGNPESQEVYRTWLVDEYGRIMARAGGIGLAEPVRNELLHLQEISHART
ncbi:MAG: rod-binding protein [Alphaproteobacteria bacterium]|nr:rod-binding protein [Alphaproteobacteria bacterium]